MYNTAYRILNNTAEAEDIIQESFLKAFQKIDSFLGDVSFGAWLKKIVVNASLDEIRKKKFDLESIENIDVLDIYNEDDEVKDFSYEIIKVRNAIMLLPEGYRIVLSLYLLEGYDHDEIAEIVGISASTSRSQLARAKKKLIGLLKH